MVDKTEIQHKLKEREQSKQIELKIRAHIKRKFYLVRHSRSCLVCTNLILDWKSARVCAFKRFCLYSFILLGLFSNCIHHYL